MIIFARVVNFIYEKLIEISMKDDSLANLTEQEHMNKGLLLFNYHG